MNKIIILSFFLLLAFLGTSQTEGELVEILDQLEPTYQTAEKDLNNHVLNTVTISLEKKYNRIHFSTPYIIKGVNISIKDRSNRVIIQQNNMTIGKEYSISFPPKSKNAEYTIILQKDNQIVVERVQKDWL